MSLFPSPQDAVSTQQRLSARITRQRKPQQSNGPAAHSAPTDTGNALLFPEVTAAKQAATSLEREGVANGALRQ